MSSRNLMRRHDWQLQAFAIVAAIGVAIIAPGQLKAQLDYVNSFGGPGTTNPLSNPNAIAIGPDGSVYVTNPGANLVNVYTPTGTYSSFLGSILFGTGIIQTPYGLAVSSSDLIYVSDATKQFVRVFTSADMVAVPEFGAPGSGNGQFQFPAGIAINSSLGYVYVADFDQNRIQVFNTAGTYQFQFGEGTLNTPVGMSLDSAGNLYVADGNNNRIDIFNSSGTFLSSFGSLGSGPGQFHSPTGVAVSATGMIYVADANNNRVDIFNSAQVFQGSISTAGGRSLNVPYGIAVAPTGMVYVAEQVGGYADRFFDPASWVSGTNSFTDPTAGPTSVNVGTGEILGASLTLNSPMGLVVGNTLTVDSGGVLSLAGGSLSASILEVAGSFNYQSGSISAATMLIDSTGTFTQSAGAISTPSVEVAGTYYLQGGSFASATLTVDAGGAFVNTHGLAMPIATSVSTAGEISLDDGVLLTTPAVNVLAGGVLSAGSATIATSMINVAAGGEVQLNNPVSARLQTPMVVNSGLIDGAGRITGTLTNNAGGEISAATAQTLVISGAGNTNAGLVTLSGGTVHFTQDLSNQNTGAIEGFGTLRVDGGLSNDGTVALAGGAGVFGPVINNATGVIHLQGTQSNAFFGNVTNNGAINIDAGASGVFYGAVTGTGTMTNAGAALLQSSSVIQSVSGNGSVTLSSAVTLDANSFSQGGLAVQLDGDTPGSYSKLDVDGTLHLAGRLTVSLADGFAPALGDKFDLLDWGALSGHFRSLSLPTLAAGLAWSSTQLYTSGALAVVSVNFQPGDFNRDGHVDAADIVAMEKALVDLHSYQLSKSLSDAQLLAIGDVNGDGKVDNADLQSLIGYLNSGSGSTASVPEPMGLVLVLCAVPLCSRCFRRKAVAAE
jgi:streptogramin lyase